jgi:hypothetical protein
MAHKMIDPLVVAYARKSGHIYKAIPFASGDDYVRAVALSNPRSDAAQDLTTVEDAVAYESEAADCDITVIDYADNTDYDNHLISAAQTSIGWVA